jgi:polysaccharide pyruvyl transferase WcaK-like protein
MPATEPADRAESGARPLYYLGAPAGFPNYGDELILAGWLRWLAETAPEADVWVDTHSPGPASVLLDGLHPRLRFTDVLWRLCGEAPSDDPWEVASWVQAAVHNPGMAPRWYYGIELLSRADVVHLVGGGYINDVWPRHVGVVAGAAAAVRRSGGRAAMTGQGLLPVADGVAPLLRALADRFDIVDVRDEATATLLGVNQGVDDAFLALGPHCYSDEDAPEVLLCLQSDLLEVGAGKLAAAVLNMLRSWKVQPEQVGIVEGIPRVDRDVYALFEHELPGARFYPFPDVWNKGLPVSRQQTWISTRFHMHLVAAAAGASGVAISVRPDYYATKHRSLASLGSRWTLVDDLDAVVAGSVPERPRSGGFAPEALGEFRQAKRDLAKSVYAPVIRPQPEPEPSPESDAGPEVAPAPPRRIWARWRSQADRA